MITAGCTMDTQIVLDALTSVLSATQLLYPANTSYRDSLQSMIKRLPPMQIGKHNQLQEWLADVDDPNNDHRHVSHLYGLYPVTRFPPMRIRSFSRQLNAHFSIGVTWLRGGLSVGKSICGHVCLTVIMLIRLSRIC